MYDQVRELLGHGFKYILIESEYGIKTNPASHGNPQANSSIEIKNQVLGNAVRTYNLQETYVSGT